VLATKISFFLLNPYFLVYALNLLQRTVDFSNRKFLAKFSILGILNLVNDLKNNTYYPKSLNKLYKLLKDGKKQLISFPSFRDRLMQYALYLVLNPLYLNRIYSKKFGVYKNPHTCLHQISSN
jgi:retron-type reverse transcriptase